MNSGTFWVVTKGFLFAGSRFAKGQVWYFGTAGSTCKNPWLIQVTKSGRNVQMILNGYAFLAERGDNFEATTCPEYASDYIKARLAADTGVTA